MSNKMEQMTRRGREIEVESFQIIDDEAGEHLYTPDQWEVVRRVIHTTADFDFKEIMKFHSKAISSAIEALTSGCDLIVDVSMIASGLNVERLKKFRNHVGCYISHPLVIDRAKEIGSTRAKEAMTMAYEFSKLDGAIIAVGNTPTSLLEVNNLIRAGKIKPALVIGCPVGFVSAVESKDELVEICDSSDMEVPYIASLGRKGGSTIVVAIIHALLKLASRSSSNGN